MGSVILRNLQSSFKFNVTLVGLNQSTNVRVQKVTTPEAFTTSERVHFENGVKKRLAGTIAIDDKLTLEAIIPNAKSDKEFMALSKKLFDMYSASATLPRDYFSTITITELNELDAPIRQHIFYDCLLEKYELPDFDATSSDNAIEKLTFMVNGYMRGL